MSEQVTRVDYVYEDAEGNPVHKSVRKQGKQGKSFLQFKWNGEGWVSGAVPLERRVVYNLPNLSGAIARGDTVLFVEGEKDVETAGRALGIVATTTPAGAGGWKPHFAQFLKGAKVVLIPDNDKPGRDYMAKVAGDLKKVSAEVKYLELPGLPNKGDLTDWVNLGNGSAALAELIGLATDPPRCTTTGDVEEKLPNPNDVANKIMQENPTFVMAGDWYVWDGRKYDNQGGKKKIFRAVRDEYGCKTTIDRINGVMGLIQGETSVDDVDNDVNDMTWINVKNGLLNPWTLETRPHDKSHLCSVAINAEWQPEAADEHLSRFIEEVFTSKEASDLFFEFVGYCFLNDCRYQKCLMLLGEGANGKSVILEVVRQFLTPEACSAISLQQATDKFGAANLIGRLVNVCADIPRRAIEDAGILKALISGDTIIADVKYGPVVSFKNRAKLIFSCNDLPAVADRSEGFYRRLLIIPFREVFRPGDGRHDPNVIGRLTTDSAMNKMMRLSIEGLRRLADNGKFSECNECRMALEEYRLENDNVSSFIRDMVTVSEHEVKTFKDECYEAYKDFCNRNGTRPINESWFARRAATAISEFKEQGKDHSGRRYYKRILVRHYDTDKKSYEGIFNRN